MARFPQLSPKGTAPQPGRITVSPSEAAALLGVSRSFFYEHVMPELDVIRLGRKRLVSLRELEAWTAREAARIV
jgi:excisionase family DNA binding protein